MQAIVRDYHIKRKALEASQGGEAKPSRKRTKKEEKLSTEIKALVQRAEDGLEIRPVLSDVKAYLQLEEV